MVVGTLVLALWVVLALWSLTERRHSVEESEERLRQTTAAAAEQTVRLFKLAEASFLAMDDWLARNPDPYPGANPRFAALVGKLRRLSDGVVDYRYLDPAGNLYLIPTPSRRPEGNVAASQGFQVQENPRSRGFYVSDPVVSPVDHKWVVPLTYPAPRPGGAVAVVAATIEVDRVTRLFEAQRLKPNGSITLVKADGTTLFRAPQIPGAIGRSLAHTQDFTRHVDLADSGVYQILGAYDRRVRLISFQKVPEYKLVAFATTTLDDALAPWRRETETAAAVAALATLLVLWLTVRFVRQAHRAEAALRRRGQELASIFDTSTVGIFFVDSAGRFLRVNARLAAMLLCPREEMMGTAYVDHVAAEERAAAAAAMAAHLDGQPAELCLEQHFLGRVGGGFWGLVTCRRMLDEDGRCLGSVGVVADVTERRASREALETLNRSLEASNNELEMFAYVASHDLREPLRMVGAYMSLLERRYGDNLDAEGHEFLAFARDGAVRMDRMVLDLLEFSRIDRQGAQMRDLPLARPVEDALENLGMLIAETKARFEADAAIEGVTVRGDDAQLTRLFQNLVGNAMKYRAPGRPPVIRIGCRPAGPMVEVSVADNGIGIDREYWERIFRVFQRLHRREDYDGTGIGLAICKKIVERHGGRIWLDSTPGEGSTFFFTLPRA